MVTISKPINGICLNPHEYLCDGSGKIKLFRSQETAMNFLKRKGVTEEDMDFMSFNEYDPKDHKGE